MAAFLWSMLAAVAGLGPFSSVASADVSGPDIVQFLNVQRAANGIPAPITHDPVLSDGCAKHDRYGAINGVLTHGEDQSKPGYTAEGDQAGKTSVLYAGGAPWSAARNPFENAPIHLHQLLAPRIDRMGAAEVSGYGCATTLASRNRAAPPADVTYSYPGDGATAWPPAQTAFEGPYTPGERVGIPQGTTTGPYLYVMFDGPGLSVFATARATAASLTGPEGPVSVVTVDNTTSGLQGYLPTGMEVIPRTPLRAGAAYRASVTASVSDSGVPARTFTRTWTFTTGKAPNSVALTSASSSGRELTVSGRSDAPGAVVTATGPGTATSVPLNPAGNTSFTVPADGTWRVCVRSGGDRSEYQPAEQCVDLVAQAPSGGGGGKDPDPRVPDPRLPEPRMPDPRVPDPGVPDPRLPSQLRLGTAVTRRTARDIRVLAACSAACDITASGSVSAGYRRVRLKTAYSILDAAGTTTLRFRLRASDVRRLRGRGKRRLRLRIEAAGEDTNVARTITAKLK